MIQYLENKLGVEDFENAKGLVILPIVKLWYYFKNLKEKHLSLKFWIQKL